MEINVNHSYLTELPAIVGISADDTGTFWIHNTSEKILQKVKLENDMRLVETIDSIKVYDISKRKKDSAVILTLYGDHHIQCLTTDSQLRNLTNLRPYLPLGIHLTANDDILVGFQENAETFPITEKSVRGILKLGKTGKEKARFELDASNRRLFSCPYRIATNINNDICVSDHLTADNTGRVVVMSPGGEIQWSYIGHPEINAGWNKFNPEGLATTSDGYVIVMDCNNHAIHILSIDGDLLHCQMTRMLNFIGPCSVITLPNSVLVIGCAASKGASDAKIVMLNTNDL